MEQLSNHWFLRKNDILIMPFVSFQYKPPLPGKKNSASTGTMSSSKMTGASSAKTSSDYRATDYSPHSRSFGKITMS